MCLVIELAKAKRQIQKLGDEVAELESSKLEFWETWQPVSSQQIEYEDLYQLLKSSFPNAVINLGENYRFLCHYDDIATFLAQDLTNKMPYVSDSKEFSSYDCNVFANRLLGQFSVPKWADLTFGKVWFSDPAHALNLMVSEAKEVLYIEPQNDKILPHDTYEAAFARLIEM